MRNPINSPEAKAARVDSRDSIFQAIDRINDEGRDGLDVLDWMVLGSINDLLEGKNLTIPEQRQAISELILVGYTHIREQYVEEHTS